MVKNIGRMDQVLRFGIAAIALYLGLIDGQLVTDTFTSYILIVIGIVALVTSLSRFCPLYMVPGINTSSGNKSK